MEKLHVDKLLKQPIKDDDLKERLENNEEVIALLKRENAPIETVGKNLIAFNHYVQVKEICNKCAGLFACPFYKKGFYDDIEIDMDFCQTVKPCHYYLEKKQMLSHKDNYLICDLSDKSLMIDIDKINLENETENYKQIVEIVKTWLEKYPAKGIYFKGPYGTGKTYLAAGITNALAKKGKKVAFVNVPALCIDIKNNVTDSDVIEEMVSKMKRAEVLVLDDIGAENLTNYIRDDILFTVLDYRMENDKRTIFTSNSDFEKLEERMNYNQNGQKDETKSQRIMERIRTLSQIVPVNGKSRRG